MAEHKPPSERPEDSSDNQGYFITLKGRYCLMRAKEIALERGETDSGAVGRALVHAGEEYEALLLLSYGADLPQGFVFPSSVSFRDRLLRLREDWERAYVQGTS